MGARIVRARGVLVAWLALTGIAGCGASSSPMLRAGSPIQTHARVAVLPLEDLSGEAAAAAGFTRMLYAELVRSGTCDVPEAGLVEDAMDSLGIRNGGSLRRDQVKALGERLHVEYLLTGTLLESGTVRTGDGEVPSVGAALKTIEVATTRAVWAQVKFRTGEDRETVFGWGREKNPQILAGSLAHDMIADFTTLTADSAAAKAGGKK